MRTEHSLYLVLPSYRHMQAGEIRDDVSFSFTSDATDYLDEITAMLRAIGYAPIPVEIGLDDYATLLAAIPDGARVLYLCDGNEITDGVCGVTPLEYLEQRALRLCANSAAFMRDTVKKEVMKARFVEAGVSTPPYVHIDSAAGALPPLLLRYPLLVKPANLYGAVGIEDDCVLQTPEQARDLLPVSLEQYGSVLVEEFIIGREFTVFLLDGGIVHGMLERAFDRDRLAPLQRFMSYSRIWKEEGDKWEFLAVTDDALAARIGELASRAYHAVGGTQYSRVDLRYDEVSGGLYVLEVNAPPSLSAWDSGMESVRLSGNGSAQDVLARILADAWAAAPSEATAAAQQTFPVTVAESRYGQAVFASADLDIDEAVAQFDGPIVPWDQVPTEERRHAILLDDDSWLIDATHARFLNHSCAPNCRIASDCTVYTTRKVAAGEELTISYNKISAREMAAALFSGERALDWDPLWTFDCQCGSPRCQGRIDRYRLLDDSSQEAGGRVYVKQAGTRGRAAFAGTAFTAGQLIERVPVIVIPAAQWRHIAPTVLFDYVFAWGDELEDAALALGHGSMFNHSYQPNARYIKRIDDLFIDYVALRDIAVDEEITINYNEDPANMSPLWFPVIEESR